MIIFIIILQVGSIKNNDVSKVCKKMILEDDSYTCHSGTVEDLKAIPDNAEIIKIKNMSIGNLKEADLSRFSNLKSLSCINSQINEIENYAFFQNNKLEILDLSKNNIEIVHSVWFSTLKSLLELNLSYNKIKWIDSLVFHYAKNIEKLNIKGNPDLQCLNSKYLSEQLRFELSNEKNLRFNECPSPN